uniref:Uncharacterized protein n=1 Tax=Anguilla anguilla TaxID=7936 RepID=A0A0E9Q118_ANGAN
MFPRTTSRSDRSFPTRSGEVVSTPAWLGAAAGCWGRADTATADLTSSTLCGV